MAIAATLDASPGEIDAKLRDVDWVSKAALGHERLIESLMPSAPAVLPMKLLTLFSGDARLVRDLTAERARLSRAAQHVAGCHEYGLRIVAAGHEPSAPAADRPASGVAFLERKKQVRDASRERASARAEFAREAFESLARASRDAVQRTDAGDEMERALLDAAFLVAADERPAFAAASERLEALAAGAHCAFRLTGPWPPYHFVQVDHAGA